MRSAHRQPNHDITESIPVIGESKVLLPTDVFLILQTGDGPYSTKQWRPFTSSYYQPDLFYQIMPDRWVKILCATIKINQIDLFILMDFYKNINILIMG